MTEEDDVARRHNKEMGELAEKQLKEEELPTAARKAGSDIEENPHLDERLRNGDELVRREDAEKEMAMLAKFALEAFDKNDRKALKKKKEKLRQEITGKADVQEGDGQ